VVVEDNTLQVHISSLRKVLGPDLIRTIHGRGYKYVGERPINNAMTPETLGQFQPIEVITPEKRLKSESSRDDVPQSDRRLFDRGPIPKSAEAAQKRVSRRDRAALSIMPFGSDAALGVLNVGRGLTHDIQYKLSKLRMLYVIAADSVAKSEWQHKGPREIGALLQIDYMCRGTIAFENRRMRVRVELLDCTDEKIVWMDEFVSASRANFELVDPIADQIINSIVSNIEIEERRRAILKHPSDLDAWDHFHLGLWQMHHFDLRTNEEAARNFSLACVRDPTFARSYAGLSFTHWLKAFALRPQEQRAAGELALKVALQGIVADSRDPSVQCALGRALWMSGATDEAIGALHSATDLSPNYAFGHYATGFVKCQSGQPDEALAALSEAEHLSPFDPFRCANLAARALALVRLGRFEEAATVATRAIQQPNAHVRIRSMAAMCLAAGGRLVEAKTLAALVRSENAYYGSPDNLKSMHFSKDDLRTFSSLAALAGLS
jgi:TolB-like protein